MMGSGVSQSPGPGALARLGFAAGRKARKGSAGGVRASVVRRRCAGPGKRGGAEPAGAEADSDRCADRRDRGAGPGRHGASANRDGQREIVPGPVHRTVTVRARSGRVDPRHGTCRGGRTFSDGMRDRARRGLRPGPAHPAAAAARVGLPVCQ